MLLQTNYVPLQLNFPYTMSAEHRINELRQKLNYLNHMYYVEAKPVATDYEFDMLLRELQDLEALHPEFADPNSPTMRVGSDLTNKFQSVAHAYPMLSLSNTYSQEELHEWIDKVCRESDAPIGVSCELKYDGTAISLTYEHGRLVPEIYSHASQNSKKEAASSSEPNATLNTRKKQ